MQSQLRRMGLRVFVQSASASGKVRAMSEGFPRWSLASLSLVHALVLGASAALLPWPSFTVFALLAGLVALAHLVTSALAFVGSAYRAQAFRITSLLSLGMLGYFAYATIGSGLYVNKVYDGVGLALLAAALAAFFVGVLFLLPMAVWGLAITGGIRPRRSSSMKARVPIGGGAALLAALVVLCLGIALTAAKAHATWTLAPEDRVAIRDAVQIVMADAAPAKKGSVGSPSLFTPDPLACARPIDRTATVFLTYLRKGTAAKEAPKPVSACHQGDTLEGALLSARSELEANQAEAEAYVDVVVQLRELPEVGPLLGAVVVRPGTEGVCEGDRCLLPWQLFGLDAFTEATNVSALQAELGTTPEALRKHLGSSGHGYAGLTALVTDSYAVSWDRVVTPMRHLRKDTTELTPKGVDSAIRSSAAFIVSSQVKDGKFRYTVQPFTGVVSFDNFSVPRQAGTTLSLCDAVRYHAKAKETARQSLAFLASLVRGNAERGVIVWPKNAKKGQLGSTALPAIAFLACREHVGTEFDETITKLVNSLMAMRRPDGSFMPVFDTDTDAAIDGKDALYAAGQAVYALVLLEGAAGEGLPKPPGLAKAIDDAMAHYSGPYWNVPLRDFFFLEENWHCLAARAALTHHRNDAYETFCTDYMDMKSRFIETETSGVDPDHVGAYAFGHVFPPHHAAAAGFTEGLAASVAVKRARGMSVEKDLATLRRTVSYLIHHQWTEDNCGVCTRKFRIPGGFSENVASPIIRIDFVQHAMAGILHGSDELGLLTEG